MQTRIQKILSTAGIASRRKAEEWIRQGMVTVNGRVVRELGSKADPEKDHIKVLGRLVNPRQPKVVLAVHKPRRVVSTLSDPVGRETVVDLLRGVRSRVYPVGRLDYDSEGLLLMTNDGDLAQRMLHPRFEVPKTYEVKVKGVLTDDEIRALSKGMGLNDCRTVTCRIGKIRKTEKNSWLRVVLREGRNRQIRRMMEEVGHRVLKLKRIRIGPIELGALPIGKHRYLTAHEVGSLKILCGLTGRPRPEPAARRVVGG